MCFLSVKLKLCRAHAYAVAHCLCLRMQEVLQGTVSCADYNARRINLRGGGGALGRPGAPGGGATFARFSTCRLR